MAYRGLQSLLGVVRFIMDNLILISERIRDHLTKQRQQSKAKYGSCVTPSCAYRGDNGLMCAVGCLIADEVYYPELESLCADVTDVVRAMQKSLGFEITEEMIHLCTNWQLYHDDEMNGFSYANWINGNEDTSPELFHIHLMGCRD